MKAASLSAIFSLLMVYLSFLISTVAGTWNDHFYQPTLAEDWVGDRSFFQIQNGVLEGESASPLATPLHVVEIATDSTDADVQCWINVVVPNTRVCTKGALILRHTTGATGYVFALHEATQTIEVYRFSTGEMLLKKAAKIELGKWYLVRAELHGPAMKFFVSGQLIGTVTDSSSLSGGVGLAVQDAELVRFDDFSITGPNVVGNVDQTARPEITFFPPQAVPNVVLRFQAAPPYDYFVQASSAPFSNEWETIKTFRAKLQTLEVEISDPITNVVRFYRVEKVPCGCR
jgi:hypothetical protein